MIAGYQGEPGAFSEEAALAAFGSIETRGYPSFEALVAAVAGGDVTHGLLPYENSIAGRVTSALAALEHHGGITVTGELAHPVEQCLIGMPGCVLQEIRTVSSHPVALAQCRGFLARHRHMRPESVADTAGAVRALMLRRDPADAALASARAAEIYGAAILQRSVQDEPLNITRFLIITAVLSPLQIRG